MEIRQSLAHWVYPEVALERRRTRFVTEALLDKDIRNKRLEKIDEHIEQQLLDQRLGKSTKRELDDENSSNAVKSMKATKSAKQQRPGIVHNLSGRDLMSTKARLREKLEGQLLSSSYQSYFLS